MQTPANSDRLGSYLVAISTAALAILLFQRHGTFPGLHGDEAWFALMAERFNTSGIDQYVGMNSYSGNLYGIIVAGFFKLFGTGVWQLRLPGVLANLAGFIAIGMMLNRFFGAKAVAIFAALFLASLNIVWFSRIAWEVTAFTIPVVGASLWLILSHLGTDAHSPAAPVGKRADNTLIKFSYFLIAWLAISSHLIFVILLFGVSAAAFLLYCIHPMERTKTTVVFLANNLFVLAAFGVRYGISETTDWGDPIWMTIGFLVVPPLLILAIYKLTQGLMGHLIDLFAIPIFAIGRAAKSGTGRIGIGPKAGGAVLAGLAVLPFLLVHGGPFLQALSGVGIAPRLAGIDVNPILRTAALSVTIAALIWSVWASLRIWSDSELCNLPIKFIQLTLIFALLVFPVIITSNSLRYCLAPQVLWLILVSALVARMLAGVSWVRFAPVFGVPIAVSAMAFLAVANTELKPPLRFYVGGTEENSLSFSSLAPMKSLMEAKGCCTITRSNFFVEHPINFYSIATPWACDPALICRGGWDENAPETGYFQLEISQ